VQNTYGRTCVIIPTLNEESSIGDLVGFFVFNELEVIVVDDNSSDNTSQIALEAGATLIQNAERKGLAKSLWQGFNLALNYLDIEYIATIDAGKSHNPNQLFEMLQLMPNNDLVIGSRFLPFSSYDNFLGKWYRPYASQVAAKLCNFAQHRSESTDWTSGFRIYRSELLLSLKNFTYNSKMHPVQIELLGRANQVGATITEYPISYVAGKTSFDKSVASEAFTIWLQLLNHYPARPKVRETELI
jgi:dolichol-phosphate mannosyltransferase